LRTGLAGLSHLNLDPWELLAARRTVAAGGEPPGDRERTLLQALALRVKAQQELDALAGAETKSGPDLLRAARATLARATQVEARINGLVEEAQIDPDAPETRTLNRSRFRLLRATADLWLQLDELENPRAEGTEGS
jgi:hypothetical protein